MDSVKELIHEITDQQAPLSQSLMKAKVVAKRMGNDALFQWISRELNGYPRGFTLPKERKIKSHIYFVGDDNGQQYFLPLTFNQDMPLDMRLLMTTYSCYTSIPAILSRLESNSEVTLKVALTEQQLAFLSQPDQQDGHIIATGYYEFPIGAIREIISSVRQQLLDMLLDISSAAIDDSQQHLSTKNTVINNIYGHGNAINLATGATVHQQVLSNKSGQRND